MTKRLASTCVLVLGVAAFAGSASAGDGNGKGKHDVGAGASAAADTALASAPGNSANAPGQIKKEAEVGPVATAASVTAAESSSEAQPGVKPASDTDKDTYAPASSDKTKLYGNGKTAGQIAMQNGASGATILHGPGNSQPHKAAPCSGGHEVDVHALKGKRLGKACKPASPTLGSNPGRADDPSPSRSNSGPSSNPSGSTDGVGDSPGATGSPADRGPKPSSSVRGSESVLAATAVAGRSASLPFTGFPLWLALLVGIGLILAGLWLLRRTAEAAD